MDFIILLATLIILAETTILLITTSKKPLLNNNQKRKVYIDTSALMDVRLLAIAETGFIGDDVIVPRSVIHELQLLADGKDSDKRARARAALDTVSDLERVIFFNLTILDDPLDHTPVDNRLLELAKSTHGAILTNDFNLNKVATVEHIDVLNINDLALALRGDYLPGEQTQVRIVAVGEGAHQGVGYLADGTMVVVDRADDKVGSEITVEFVRLRQTSAGRMMFAKPANVTTSAKGRGGGSGTARLASSRLTDSQRASSRLSSSRLAGSRLANARPAGKVSAKTGAPAHQSSVKRSTASKSTSRRSKSK